MFPLTLFLSVTILLLSWMQQFHDLVPFSTFEYTNSANHYIQDPRIEGKPFSLLTALGQFDSQWYLKNADQGYPWHPNPPQKETFKNMGGISYTFLPLLPLIIASVNIFIHHVEISAFLVNNLILLACVLSMHFIVKKWYAKEIAHKTIVLLLVFPFSIFFHGYYTEGIRLFLFLWFCYGLVERKYLLSAVSLGLASISSGIMLFLQPFYLGILLFNIYKKKIPFWQAFWYGVIAVLPFSLWVLFCFIYTGDGFYFVKTLNAWMKPPIFPPLYNLYLLYEFPSLPVRSVYGSRLDVLCILLVLCLSYLSKKVVPKLVWYATLIVAFTPLFLQDSISYIRYSIILFPFYIYLATALPKKYYYLLVGIFIVGLLYMSLYYINWYWVE